MNRTAPPPRSPVSAMLATRHRPADKAEQRRLAAAYRAAPPGSPERRAALEPLLETVYALVLREASRWSRRFPSADFDDLAAAGLLGATVAADRFDLDRGVKFVTYAHWWILREIQLEAHAAGGVIAAGTKTPRAATPPLGETPAVCDGPSPEDAADVRLAAAEARRVVAARLPESYRAVVLLRLGLGPGGGPALRLSDIAERQGVTRERVRQILVASAKRLPDRFGALFSERA